MIVPATPHFGYAGPEPGFGKPAEGGATPLWDQLLFVAPWEAYRRYGDTTALRTAYGAMREYLLTWLPRWYRADGDDFAHTLTSGLGDWATPTGADAPPGTPPGRGTNFAPDAAPAAASTAYVAYLASVASGVAHVLGEPADERLFAELRQRVRADFHARFYDVAGFYREDEEQPFLQTVQALALCFDLVPRKRRAALQKQLVADVMTTRSGHQEAGIAGSRWILPALTDAAHEGIAGAAGAAATIVKQTTYPSYGYWRSLGWTGLGEYWEKDSRTRNHEMHGAVGQWLYEGLAGLQPAAPGYRRVLVRPLVPPGIASASARYHSVRGEIAVSWQRSPSGALKLKVEIPANTTATVYVPGTDPAQVRESGVPAERSPAVTLRRTTKDAVIYTTASGTYTFEVTA